ncbi:MAG: hypothetical protein LUD72_00885 [Bacteroidales bacterium]|nr:hypothetical protein [Bacteroidales bacterium]
MKKTIRNAPATARAAIPNPDADGVRRTDFRFDADTLSLLKSLIGKTMSRVLYQCFVGKDNAYGRVFFDIEGVYFRLSNFTESLRYMGTVEDVAVYRFGCVDPSEAEEARQDGKMLDVTVNRVIERIQVVNENQRLFKNGALAEEADVVRGLVFVFEDGEELSAEKSAFFFLEEIYVKFGKGFSDGYEPLEEGFLDGWDEVPGCEPKASREIVTISGPTDGR